MKLLAFLGVLAAISLQPSVAVAKSGHVYVALEQLTGFGGAPPMILRYPLKNNVIGTVRLRWSADAKARPQVLRAHVLSAALG